MALQPEIEPETNRLTVTQLKIVTLINQSLTVFPQSLSASK